MGSHGGRRNAVSPSLVRDWALLADPSMQSVAILHLPGVDMSGAGWIAGGSCVAALGLAAFAFSQSRAREVRRLSQIQLITVRDATERARMSASGEAEVAIRGEAIPAPDAGHPYVVPPDEHAGRTEPQTRALVVEETSTLLLHRVRTSPTWSENDVLSHLSWCILPRSCS